MKTVKERNELFAAGGVHRQLQSGLDSFGAAVGEVCSRWRGNRHNLVELLRERGHVPVVVISAAHMNQLFGLVVESRSTTSG